MSIKSTLKAAKTALDAGDYDATIAEAQKVVDQDKSNYFAQLFLGRAYEKKGRAEDAENAYSSATRIKGDDAKAWIGLCSLYETLGASKVDEYREAAVKVARHHGALDDKHRCQVVIDKLVEFVKQYGSSKQYARTLEILLPLGPVYEYLEGRIQHPSLTYARLVEITEQDEEQSIEKKVADRRGRIGTRIAQVRSDARREVFEQSPLEDLYQQTINWSNDDEVRREHEEKLLRRAYELLVLLPAEIQRQKLDQVLNLAEGMVIIHHPFQLAWDLVLESRDVHDLAELDSHVLREYVSFFPQSALGKIFQGWLTSEVCPFPPVEEEDHESIPVKPMSQEDRLCLMTEGLSAADESPLAYRFASEYYLHLEEHDTAIESARKGLVILFTKARQLGMTLQNTRDCMNAVLATSLVHHQAPRHHVEARRLFENLLERKPRSSSALIGLGLIFQQNEQHQRAIEFLSEALQVDSNNIPVGTELAWCRALSGDFESAQLALEDYLSRLKGTDPRTRDLKAQILHRVGVCVWNIDRSRSARKDRKGAYKHFIAAVKSNANYAPAYTSLGVYYTDYARDSRRGRQCFQKAFELSAAETDAAERLATIFAEQGDWDIVEVVAQRVIDTGKARPPPGSKNKGLSWPFSSLGVVQMNKLEYQQAITSFLAALRISPDDYQSYIGLGESYHHSGRYNSALRTFRYALEPHDTQMRILGETWFAKYMLANVHRELGDYEEAIVGLQEVLEERPKEFGARMSLLQAFVERGQRAVETGSYGEALRSAANAIETATTTAEDRPYAFNLWKGIGDACSIFTSIQSGMKEFPFKALRDALERDTDDATYAQLVDVDKIDLKSFESAVSDGDCSLVFSALAASILAYKRAIHCCSSDIYAQAVAWYNLGWAEHKAYLVVDIQEDSRKYLKASVRCFKRAIELEAGNAEFWNALGVVCTTLSPMAAQHSFVRSLHLNELNAKVWTNLGVLYLLQNDHELAHSSFGRAQSTDPNFAHAWVGEGLIALSTGDAKAALDHFTHAFEISDSDSIATKRRYSISVFDHMLLAPSSTTDLAALIRPLFALQQLDRQVPRDLLLQHMTALCFERVGNHAEATEILLSLCHAAEADYENSESLSALARFVHAKADLCRNQLATGAYSSAAENAETVLDLTTDPESSGLEDVARRKIRLSAFVSAIIALYHQDKSAETLDTFRNALSETKDDPDVVILLAKVLWQRGEPNERAVARDQLFESLERHPDHVASVTLMGAIAVLEDDRDTISAVQDDISGLRTKEDLQPGESSVLEGLLCSFSALHGDTSKGDAALSAARQRLVLHPGDFRAWSHFADVSGDQAAADMALKIALQTTLSNEPMSAETLAGVFAAAGDARNAQRAVFLSPWTEPGWRALARVCQGQSG